MNDEKRILVEHEIKEVKRRKSQIIQQIGELKKVSSEQIIGTSTYMLLEKEYELLDHHHNIYMDLLSD